MKKIFFILSIMLSVYSFGFDDIPSNFGVNVDYTQNQDSLANVDKMKKADKVKQAENIMKENQKPVLKFDTKQIIQQRVLDYTTDQPNSMIAPGSLIGF